jgi:predicted RNA-binding Zn ribbon-like protein
MARESFRFPALLGGDLCLNFSNTIEFRDSERCFDALPDYENLLAWCEQRELIFGTDADRLSALAVGRAGEVALADALELRDALYHIFTATIDAERPAPADLALVNDVMRMTPHTIVPNGAGFIWTWSYSDEPAGILAPIALAAGDLLTSERLQWVRQCPNCGWLFLDTSRNHSRRWCSMDICGSQVKSRRQYERRKQSSD